MPRTSIKRVRRFAAAAVLGTLLTACGSGTDSGAPENAGSAAPGTTTDVKPVKSARTITDINGVTIDTKRPPQRVVCLVALCDDILTELGLEPVATNSALLAHPRFLGPERAGRIPVIPGGFLSPETEAILSHKPDLVIGLKDTHGKLAPALKGATTFWPVQPEKWEDSVSYLRDLGALTGRGAKAEAAEKAFRTKLAAAEKKRSEQTSLIIFGSDENFGVATPGGDVTAGLFPKISDYPWRSRGIDGTYSMEEIIAKDVDVLFVETMAFGKPDGKLSEKLAENPLWKQIPAVKNGKVFEVNPEIWAKGRGTRSLGLVLDEATAELR